MISSASRTIARLATRTTIALLGLTLALTATVPAPAQGTRRQRRESNANRKARIARTIEQTYGYKYEVGGGGGFLRFRPGQTLQKNNEVTFNANATYNLSPKLGVMGDVIGAYGNAKIPNNPFNEAYHPLISQYYFTAGPSYRFVAQEKFSVTGHITAGVAYGNFDGGAKGLTSADLHLWETGLKPVAQVGANLDYNLYPNVVLRVSPTYLATFWRLSNNDTTTGSHGTVQNQFGVNAGVVVRFGHH